MSRQGTPKYARNNIFFKCVSQIFMASWQGASNESSLLTRFYLLFGFSNHEILERAATRASASRKKLTKRFRPMGNHPVGSSMSRRYSSKPNVPSFRRKKSTQRSPLGVSIDSRTRRQSDTVINFALERNFVVEIAAALATAEIAPCVVAEATAPATKATATISSAVEHSQFAAEALQNYFSRIFVLA